MGGGLVNTGTEEACAAILAVVLMVGFLLIAHLVVVMDMERGGAGAGAADVEREGNDGRDEARG